MRTLRGDEHAEYVANGPIDVADGCSMALFPVLVATAIESPVMMRFKVIDLSWIAKPDNQFSSLPYRGTGCDT